MWLNMDFPPLVAIMIRAVAPFLQPLAYASQITISQTSTTPLQLAIGIGTSTVPEARIGVKESCAEM